MKHRGVLGVVTTLVILLAGCGSPSESAEPSAVQSDQGQPSPSPTPSPSQTKSSGTPTKEGGSTTETLDAAGKAAVERSVSDFLQALNNAYQTGKTADVRSRTHKKCGLCVQALAYIDDTYAKGGRIENCRAAKPEGVEIGDLVILEGRIRQVHYNAKVTVTECRTYDKSGRVVDRDPAGVENMRITVEQAGQQWKIRVWQLD